MDSFFQILKNCGAVFENSYVICDYNQKDCPLVYVNDSFVRLTGYEKEEILNRNCRFLQGEKTNQLTIRQLSEVIKKGENGWFDILNYRKNGEEFWNRLTLIPIGGDVEPIKFYLGIQQDVSDLKNTGESYTESGSLKSSGKSLTAPLMNILNASRSLKYFNDGSEQALEKLEQLSYESRKEVEKIAQYVRSLG